MCHMGTVYKQSQLSKPVDYKSHRYQWIKTWTVRTVIKVSILFYIPICCANISDCVQKTPCSCSYSDGSGFIDLHPISRSDGKPYFTNISDADGGLVEYNPCASFSIINSDVCKDVLICRKSLTNSTFSCLGNLDNVSFEFDHQTMQHYLLFTSVKGNSSVQTFVNLICTPNKSSPSLTAVRNDSDRYYLNLSSRFACKVTLKYEGKSLSFGSWLCIIFVSMAFGYFGTGIIYRRVVHEASGIEVLPHHEFWTELPSLVKDGYIFFISPCLGNDARYHAYRYEPL